MRLNEDRVVKFNGDVAPDFGWCVIICGGSGSGKSTFRNVLGIKGKVCDVDELKKFATMYRKSVNGDQGYQNYLHIPKDSKTDQAQHDAYVSAVSNPNIRIPKGKDIGFDEVNLDKATVDMKDGNGEVPVGKPYDLSNLRYVYYLHHQLDNFSDEYKASFFNEDPDRNKDRLPNLIFDITGKTFGSIEAIVSKAEAIGYKVAIVWVLVSTETALARNAKRARKVDPDVVTDIHRRVKTSMSQVATNMYNRDALSSEILDDQALFYAVDEFWIVVNENEDVFSGKYIDIKDDGTNNKYDNKYSNGIDSSGRKLNCYRITSIDDLNKIVGQYIGESLYNPNQKSYVEYINKIFEDCKIRMIQNNTLRNI